MLLLAAASARAAEISVVRPASNETIHSNQGKLTVVVRRAGAAPGSKIRLVLDGTVLPHSYRSGPIKLRGIERGSHTLKAVLLDAGDRRIAASAAVTFHMWQASRLFPSRK